MVIGTGTMQEIISPFSFCQYYALISHAASPSAPEMDRGQTDRSITQSWSDVRDNKTQQAGTREK